MRTIYFKDGNYLFLPYNIFGFRVYYLRNNKVITFISRVFQFQTIFLNDDIKTNNLYYVIDNKEVKNA